MRKTLTFIIISCSITMVYSQTDEAIIRKAREQSNAAIAHKDVHALSEYWMDDFVLVRGNGTHSVGKDSSVAIWTKTFRDTPRVTFIRSTAEVKVSHDNLMAWERGTWEGVNTYSKGGEYSAMWRKVNGAWKLQAELFVALN